MKQKKSPHLNPLPRGEEASNLSKIILEKLTVLEELLKKKDDRPLTFKEACTYLGYAPSYLYKLTYRKIIPHYKPTGKMIFFSKNEVDEWIFRSNVERRVMSDDASTGSAPLSTGSLGMTKDDGSAPHTTKDPNQIEMELKSEDTSTSLSASSEKEIVIEFPLKSRRKK